MYWKSNTLNSYIEFDIDRGSKLNLSKILNSYRNVICNYNHKNCRHSFSNMNNDQEKVCCYPDLEKIEKVLSKINNKIEEAEITFCPQEIFEGADSEGPKARIEPDHVIQYVRENINSVFTYLNWFCDGFYNEDEWIEIQAEVLTQKLLED